MNFKFEGNQIKRYCILFACIAVAAYLLVLWQFPYNSLFWDAVQNSGHGVVTFFLTFAVAFVNRFASSKTALLYYFVVVTVLGIVVEIVQSYVGRQVSFRDIALNTCGVLLAIMILVMSKNASNWKQSAMHYIFLFLFVGTIFFSPMRVLVARIASPDLPVVINFNTVGSSVFIKSNNVDSRVGTYTLPWSDNPSASLRVKFPRSQKSSLEILEPPRNWSQYRYISFKVMNTGIPFNLRFRIDDKSIGKPGYSFAVVSRNLPSGYSDVVIPLDEFRQHRYAAGVAQLNEISRILIFSYPASESRLIYIDDIELGT